MLGPLQLIVIGFDEDKYARDIILELKRLRKSNIIRLFDLLYAFKHPDGSFEAKEISDLQEDEQREFGTVIKTLIGLTGKDLENLDTGEVIEGLEAMGDDFGLSETELQTVADRLPNNSSAIFVLFEHTWARGVKEAMLQSGGTVRAQGFVDPNTLKVATNELATVLAAINRSEAAAMEKMAEVITGAKVEQEEAQTQTAEAKAQAEAAAVLAAAALAEAKEKAEEADQIAAEAQAREEEARLRAEEVEAEAEAREDAAFAEVEAVRRAAQRQVEKAEAKAAEAIRQAEDIEAQAVLRALNALVAAKVIERQAARPALEAVIAADVIDYTAARKAATALSAKP